MGLAQDTREATLSQQRADKAKSLKPYEGGKLERALLWFEESDPIEKIAPHDGFYLEYGFRWKPVGAGLGVGGGWRHDLFNRNARILFGGGISTRNYQMLQADFSLPYLASNRLELGVHAVYRHNPQEDYWGLGADSLKDNRVSYLVDYTDYEGRAIVRPLSWVEAGTRFGFLQGSIGPGTDKRFPTIEELFNDQTAPGLAVQPDYSFAEVFGAVDYRDQDDNARDGGFYSFTWREYSDLDFDRYSFRAVDLLLQQFVPIFDKKRVFAVQGRLQAAATDDGAGQIVPFYFRPTLGGSTSHRGFNDFRFRDDSVVNVNVEYPMGSVLRARYGAVLGLGRGRAQHRQAQDVRAPERVRVWLPVQHLQNRLVPHRSRLWRRRRAGILQVQQGLLSHGLHGQHGSGL